MTINDNDKNEFKDIEASLRKAFAGEKQQGLAPHQLRALHEAVDGGTARPLSRSRWWQWSMAVSLVAAASVAVIVVDRFPGTNDAMIETLTPQANEQSIQSNDQPAPPPMALSDSGAATRGAPAESPPGQSAAKADATSRMRESRKEKTVSGHTAKSEPKAKKALAKPSAAAPEGGQKGGVGKFESASPSEPYSQKLDTKSQLGASVATQSAADTAPSTHKKSTQPLQIGIASVSFKGKGSASDIRSVVRENMNGLKHCYAALLERSPSAKGSMTLVWQIPNFKLKMSADIFADTPMRACVQKAMAGWSYPPGTLGNAEVTLRFGYLK